MDDTTRCNVHMCLITCTSNTCTSTLKRQSRRRSGSESGLDGVLCSFIETPGDDAPDTKGEADNTKGNERAITNIGHGRHEAAANRADN
eukprot:CAMPEP_0197721182 /NCGR_PEP_ID=MMETSP1434-20131217/4326_1 /TAXON_ID=265543 /ORGANISM="Minutocellus polymorphus, Strain CCMP3303" /LENGTH=88 /DNA_ID=CAMNT_0043306157 /DNA_START=104 /DNA_END=367 /DNA_ORIENTATION=-